jgi:hypothetical protein
MCKLHAQGVVVVGVVVVGALLALPACGSLVDEDEGEVPITEIPYHRRAEIKISKGFVNGKAVEFYKLGEFAPTSSGWFPSYDKFPGMTTGEMYVWTDGGGRPSLDTKQLPIIDALPLQAEYSDFFEIVAVEPDEGYADNDIKSRATLIRAGFDFTYTNWVVNCPVVGPGTSLERASGYRKLKVWYRGQITYCYMMDGLDNFDSKGAASFKLWYSPHGDKPKADGRNDLRVPAQDVYTMLAYAFSGQDQVSKIPVKGNDIFRYALGDRDKYSPLVKVWDVTVPGDYQLKALDSWDDLFPLGEEFTDTRIAARSPETFCNCPIRR